MDMHASIRLRRRAARSSIAWSFNDRGLRQDIRQDMAQMKSRLDKRISGLESQFGELRERTAHLEGLREAISGRAPAS